MYRVCIVNDCDLFFLYGTVKWIITERTPTVVEITDRCNSTRITHTGLGARFRESGFEIIVFKTFYKRVRCKWSLACARAHMRVHMSLNARSKLLYLSPWKVQPNINTILMYFNLNFENLFGFRVLLLTSCMYRPIPFMKKQTFPTQRRTDNNEFKLVFRIKIRNMLSFCLFIGLKCIKKNNRVSNLLNITNQILPNLTILL